MPLQNFLVFGKLWSDLRQGNCDYDIYYEESGVTLEIRIFLFLDNFSFRLIRQGIEGEGLFWTGWSLGSTPFHNVNADDADDADDDDRDDDDGDDGDNGDDGDDDDDFGDDDGNNDDGVDDDGNFDVNDDDEDDFDDDRDDGNDDEDDDNEDDANDDDDDDKTLPTALSPVQPM